MHTHPIVSLASGTQVYFFISFASCSWEKKKKQESFCLSYSNSSTKQGFLIALENLH